MRKVKILIFRIYKGGTVLKSGDFGFLRLRGILMMSVRLFDLRGLFKIKFDCFDKTKGTF